INDASSFTSIQIDRTRTARRSGQNSTYNTPIRMRTRLKSHLSEARSRYVIIIPRISVRRLLARSLVLLAVVLPVYRFSNPGAVRRHTGSASRNQPAYGHSKLAAHRLLWIWGRRGRVARDF